MTLEPKSNAEHEAEIGNVGRLHGRRHRGIAIPVTRLHASALHSLDPIEGWLPVDDALEVLSPSAWIGRWRENRLTPGERSHG